MGHSGGVLLYRFLTFCAHFGAQRVGFAQVLLLGLVSAAPSGLVHCFVTPHGWRRGLRSCAASRLKRFAHFDKRQEGGAGFSWGWSKRRIRSEATLPGR